MKIAFLRKASLIIAGRVFFIGIWFLASIVLIRFLGKTEAGIFSMCMAILRILVLCLGDPFDMVVLRKVPVLLASDRPSAYKIVRTVFSMRLVLGLCICTAVALSSRFLARIFLHDPEKYVFIILASLGMIGDLLVQSLLNYFQAEEKYPRFIVIDALCKVLRVLLIVCLIVFNLLDARTALLSYVIVSYVIFIVGLFMIPRELFGVSLAGKADTIEILHFSKWIVMTSIIVAIYERVDVLLIGSILGSASAGIYSAAFALASIPDLVLVSIVTLIQPRIVGWYNDGDFRRIQRTFIRWGAAVGIVLVIIAQLVCDFAFAFIYSDKYIESVLLFRFLIIGSISWLVMIPMSGSLLYLVAPKYPLIIAVMQITLLVGGNLIVIPLAGLPGAAVVVAGTRIIVGLMTNIFGQIVLKKQPIITTHPICTVGDVE